MFTRAVMTNLLARFAPAIYMRLTKETGRGSDEMSAVETADYFRTCFDDYRMALGLAEGALPEFLRGKTILEYGPGDILGVALLMYANGADRIRCVDRFALARTSETNLQVYQSLLEGLEGDARTRGAQAFKSAGDPASGFHPDAISYEISENGLANCHCEVDLAISRAVLEHVNALPETFLDIRRSLKPNGVSLHQVDLKSHGLDRDVEFDFLTWPRSAYHVMFSHKGFPNRWRVDKYRECAKAAGFDETTVEPIGTLEPGAIDKIYADLDREFKDLPKDELAVTAFWIYMKNGAAG